MKDGRCNFPENAPTIFEQNRLKENEVFLLGQQLSRSQLGNGRPSALGWRAKRLLRRRGFFV